MPTYDAAYENGTSLGSGNSLDNTLHQPGAESLSGSVTRASTSYDVDAIWQDESGNDIETESLASGVAAGTQTTFDVPARAPNVKLQVSDAGSGSGAVDLVAHLR